MRSLTFILLIGFAVLALATGVFATANIPGLGDCNSAVVGQFQNLSFNNACGTGAYQCVYYRPGGFVNAGYRWSWRSCALPANDSVCCGSPYMPTCGYAAVNKQCGPCKTCDGNGTCGTNRPDGEICQENESSGYCGQGGCSIDDVSPYPINSQKNIYIKNMEDIKNATIDVDFIDNIKLKEYTVKACDENSAQYFVNLSELLPAPIFEGNCALETFPLTGAGYGQNWKLSSEMWDWILERIANQGKVSIGINLTDGVDNENLSDTLFYVINDYTKPSVTVSHSVREVPGGNEVTVTASPTDMLGETSVQIFIDGTKVGGDCIESSCSVSRLYAEGAHTYFAFVTDSSGNNATSETKTFSFIQAEPTCSESFGEICSAGTTCSQSTFKASDTDSCCIGSCNLDVVALPTCSDQNGLAFNPATDICTGNEIAAEGLTSPLRCCIGTLNKIPEVDRLEVYWANERGERISSASLQDNVKCVASGLIGAGEMTVTKNGEDISQKSISLPSSSTFLVGETGNYECAVQVGGKNKVSSIRVIEAPAMPKTTSLPVFGFANVLSALGLIFAYYFVSSFKKKDN